MSWLHWEVQLFNLGKAQPRISQNASSTDYPAYNSLSTQSKKLQVTSPLLRLSYHYDYYWHVSTISSTFYGAKWLRQHLARHALAGHGNTGLAAWNGPEERGLRRLERRGNMNLVCYHCSEYSVYSVYSVYIYIYSIYSIIIYIYI